MDDSSGMNNLDDSSTMNQVTDDTLASSSAVSSVERRLNEGKWISLQVHWTRKLTGLSQEINLKTHSKIYSLTGHGQIRRKQVAEDGKSLRSRKSFSEDPFASRPGSSGITRTPTSLETRLKEEMTLDENAEHIPDLPSQNYIDELHQPQSRRPRNSISSFIPHHDDILSSSPIAQSTPRIRLEPAYQEDGRTTLRNVSAESPSMFDQDNSSVVNNSEMDIDSPPAIQVRSRRRSGGRRRSVQARDSYVSTRPYARVKKHPSPSKAELERLGKALDTQLGRGSFNEDDKGDDDVAMGGTDYRPRPTPGILANFGYQH